MRISLRSALLVSALLPKLYRADLIRINYRNTQLIEEKAGGIQTLTSR